jgi:uncharacterized membrane protein YdbT with pleckstrin-like domain
VRYIEESLSEGEKIVSVFKQHWVTRLWLVLWILLLVTIPIAVYEWLRLRTIEHGVTNKRVIYKRGIVSRHTEEMKLGSIETVEIDQGIWGRILGFGDIHVTGKGISEVVFRRMDDPMEVKRRIEGVSHPAA